MEVADAVVPTTPVSKRYSHDNLFKTEDSGYHTFSPTRIDFSQDHLITYVSIPSNEIRSRVKSYTPSASRNDSVSETRRVYKRTYQEDTLTPTPTREISRKIQKLNVSDNNSFCSSFRISADQLEHHRSRIIIEPTTPVKACKPGCHVSPYKKGKRLNFNAHSLKCENLSSSAIKLPLVEPAVKYNGFKLGKKFNIIKLLIQCKIYPPVLKILQYLSDEDLYKLSLACSETWREICDKILHNAESIRQRHIAFLNSIKENKRSDYDLSFKNKTENNQVNLLKDIHNLIPYGKSRMEKPVPCEKIVPQIPARQQLLCVLCFQPAEIIEELSGEQWAQCSKLACSHQFCKLCKSKRHPGKKCIQYDLEGPSPSKRKKVYTRNFIGSRTSRNILSRLMCKD